MSGASGSNPLLSTKSSDTNLQVALHPLILLTISDSITRHHVRNEKGVVVGALLGQLSGRSLTIEHAFPCNVIAERGQDVILHTDWFEERLKQYKDVHKQPVLELVGWFTVAPESGPTLTHLPIHHQILAYNESPVLLAFHTASLSSIASNTAGKLPLTLYESVEELEHTDSNDGKNKDVNAMQVDGDEARVSTVRFRPLSYSVETDETEMIGIDYVAKGGGNAAAIDTTETQSITPEASGRNSRKGKGKASKSSEEAGPLIAEDASNMLSAEDEDLIATLTTRLNSVRMLQSRVALLHRFIDSLAPSSLSHSDISMTPESPSPGTLPYLRQISALVTRLSLLTPSPIVTDAADPTSQADINLTAQSNDVNLTALLSLLSKNIQGANELGRKFAATEQSKVNQKQGKKMMGGGGGRFDFAADQVPTEAEYDLM